MRTYRGGAFEKLADGDSINCEAVFGFAYREDEALIFLLVIDAILEIEAIAVGECFVMGAGTFKFGYGALADAFGEFLDGLAGGIGLQIGVEELDGAVDIEVLEEVDVVVGEFSHLGEVELGFDIELLGIGDEMPEKCAYDD